MIVIGLLFGCILWQEVRYMRRKKRKRRTFIIVIGMVVFLFIGMEAIYILRVHWTIGQAIEQLFAPIHQMLQIGEQKK